jgi:uncharacterized protein (DUF1810 family)
VSCTFRAASAVISVPKEVKENTLMWFVFPQYRGLGKSNLSDYYGIKVFRRSQNRYMQHPIISRNLIEATLPLLGI